MIIREELGELMETMAKGDLYDDDHPLLISQRRIVKKALDEYFGASEDEKQEKIKAVFAEVKGSATVIWPATVEYGMFTKIGKNFFANTGLIVFDNAPVTIGDNVRMGPNVHLLGSNHAIDPEERNDGAMFAKPITIGDDVWIGAGAMILGGVEIGKGSIIGAGSVVTRSVPPMSRAAGNPCRVIREITAADKRGWTKPVYKD